MFLFLFTPRPEYAEGCRSSTNNDDAPLMLTNEFGVINVRKSQYLTNMKCKWKISVEDGKVQFAFLFKPQ